MRKYLFLIVTVALTLGLAGCGQNNTNNQMTDTSTNSDGQTATIKTARGEFAIALDSGAAPKTVENFIKKSKDGFYNGKIFHRVEDWVVQGGDPAGNGTGGGDQDTELSDRPFVEGSVGVARAGNIKVSNDSQFFICTTDCTFLNNQYTYFGKVTSGMDNVKKIQIGDKIDSIEIK